MTKKWLCLTPNPPRIPVFFTLTKIHKPTPVGRPIISGCDGPTERLSSFVDRLLQPIAQKQKSYLKDTTHFINLIETTRVPKNAILVSMDVTSLRRRELRQCARHKTLSIKTVLLFLHSNNLKRALKLILQESSFEFNGKNYLQTHGNAMGTKMAVAFANIFMAEVETEILNQSTLKSLVWKRYIDDIFSLWEYTQTPSHAIH